MSQRHRSVRKQRATERGDAVCELHVGRALCDVLPAHPAFNKTFLHVTASGTDNGFCKPDIILNDGATPAGTRSNVICFSPTGGLTNARYFHSMGYDKLIL